VTIGDSSEVNKSTTATSTATSLPFGTFNPLTTVGAESKAVAHGLNVKPNGTTGYTASVTGGTSAMSANGGGDTISYVSADTDWAEASTSGFGVNSQGGDAVTATFGTVGGTLGYESIASALTVAISAGPTAGPANTTVVFRVQVAVTQEAGDYSGDVNSRRPACAKLHTTGRRLSCFVRRNLRSQALQGRKPAGSVRVLASTRFRYSVNCLVSSRDTEALCSGPAVRFHFPELS
jgi:hypothetical protein